MSGSGGRPRDTSPSGSEWITVREAADLLQRTQQAIRNRIQQGSITYDVQLEEGKQPAYRVLRSEVEEEAARRTEPATVEVANERTRDIVEAFQAGIERLEASDERTRAEVETQHTQLVPLAEQMRANQARMLGGIEEIKNQQAELYKLIREAMARAEEEDRREREYQQKNLELQRELRDLVKEARQENTRARQQREAEGLPERRSWLRRLFGS
jgi:hypothetical protein